jgi:hypothetical protein
MEQQNNEIQNTNIENNRVEWYNEKLDESLEELIREDNIQYYDANCVRKKSNISKTSNNYKFDNPEFKPEILLNDMKTNSPKLMALLNKIEDLDKSDLKKHGKLFKHFIFSDLKSNSAGVKLIASSMLAKGFQLGYKAEPVNETSNSKKKFKKIELLTDNELKNTTTKNKNFYLLTSIGLYDQNITVAMKKQILKTFNQRPENVHGELVRFIVMDSGFKEGIDLFDIKYIHIFEPSVVSSDQKQVIGRGTRTCGQKGLEFQPTRGWPLHVYVYDLNIPEKLQASMMDSKTTIELYLKAMNLDVRLMNFSHDLEKTSVLCSADYELNKNIHSFSIANREQVEDNDRDYNQYVYGGSHKKYKLKIVDKLTNREDIDGKIVLPNGTVIEQPIQNRMNYQDLKKHIREHYSQFTWDHVKLENLCEEKKGGASGEIIQYTPTQDFIRHYFTPQNPVKGMLLWHSVGSGKTCSAIAAATSTFEKQGYTILWVTRTTLKSDIWKNMFGQVCSESIRENIQNSSLVIPDEQKRRMKLLSKSWRIRPISYKQFSNLVSKQNAYYKTLVKINGEIDPLRKTLLIIDEAHKLYGGGDLSTIERPDMNALHQALINSYQISGADSVKLLLMTATPITQNPMELIQLLNLCKPSEEQMPTNFDEFSNKYLDENGKFTEKGREHYLDDIAGHLSYLNREKDARQFAQPVIHNIHIPIIESQKDVEKFDKKYVRKYLESDISQLKKNIDEKTRELEGDANEIDAHSFDNLYKKCDGLEEKQKPKCEKVVRSHIKQLVNEAQLEANIIKENIKELREQMKNKNLLKKTSMEKIDENTEKYAHEYEKFKNTFYYNIKYNCSKTLKTKSHLREEIKEHPNIIELDKRIERLNKRITELQSSLKNNVDNYKNRIKQIRLLLKTDLNPLEKSVVRLTIKAEQKTVRNLIKTKEKETTDAVDKVKKMIKKTQKRREKRYKKVRNTIKKIINDDKREQRETKKAEMKLRKTLRKTGEYNEEFKDETIRNLVNKYSQIIDEDLAQLDKDEIEKEEMKERKKQEKQAAVEIKKAEKEAAKNQKLLEKQTKKEAIMRERDEKRDTKKAQKELEKQEKEAEKTAKKLARKTVKKRE